MAKQTTKWVAGFEWGNDKFQIHEVACTVGPKTLTAVRGTPAEWLLGYRTRFDIADTRFADSRDEALRRCAAKLQSEVSAAEQDIAQLKVKLSKVNAVISGEKTP
jgi:hypothetical protein